MLQIKSIFGAKQPPFLGVKINLKYPFWGGGKKLEKQQFCKRITAGIA